MKNNKSGTFFSAKVMVAFFSFVVLGGGVFLQSAHADNGVLAVTQISPVQTYASADGTYADGWKWTFNITVPANETVLQMEFSDWTGSSSTIPAANNIQFYSAQSTNASNEAQAIPITASGTYSAPMYLNPSSDLSTSTAGNQIQITLETRVPVGSSGGSYSTSYGINTSFSAPTSTGANPPAITDAQSTNVTSGGATITWTTNGYGNSEVYFGTQSGTYSSSTSNSNTVSSGGAYTHSVTLSGLNASTTYYYEVASADNSGDIGVSGGYSFVTQTLPVGSFTVTQNSSFGTQNIGAGAADVEIGSYALEASSVEGVNVDSVGIQTNGDSNGVFGSPFQNLKAVVNGTQFGLTQGVVASGTAYTFSGTPFEIPASGTVDVNVYADTSSSTPSSTTASPATILTGLSGTGVISSGVVSIVTPVSGQNVNFIGPIINLTASENHGLGSPISASEGASDVKIGSYTLTAGQVNSINLSGITINVTSALPTNYLMNLRVMDGSTQVGQTYAQVTGGSGYSFNGNSPIAIAANGSVTLDVYADISSDVTATTTVGATSLTSVNASTQSGNAVTVTAIQGQSIDFNTGGVLTGSLSAGTSQASYLGMGITGVNVAQYQFVADNNGSETLTQLKIVDSSTTPTIATSSAAAASDLINYRLTNSAGTVLSTANEVGGVLTFNLTGLVVPSNSTQYVNLVADTNSYPYATSGDSHAYGLESYNYTNASQSVTTSTVSNFMGNLFTVYQTTLGVTGASFSNPNSISGVGNTVGEFTFTAGSGNMNPIIKSVSLSTKGTLLQANTTQTLGLYDASAPSVLLASSTLSGTGTGTFTMTGSNWTLPYNSSKSLIVKTYAPPGNLVSQTNSGGSYQVLLNGVTWSDGTAAAGTSNVSSLSPSIAIPVASQNITNLSN